jgi:hypothetical protein
MRLGSRYDHEPLCRALFMQRHFPQIYLLPRPMDFSASMSVA